MSDRELLMFVTRSTLSPYNTSLFYAIHVHALINDQVRQQQQNTPYYYI
jgi:hypothetical protein